MSRTGVGIRVLIDGAQLDDGCIDWATPPDPVVPFGVVGTSGLSITWGRETTVDQPQPSTCTFKVADEPGGASVLQTIKLGSRVDVFADATISGPSLTNAFTDPSFDVEVRGTVRNATLARVPSAGQTWTETRRNRFGDPRGTSISPAYWGTTGGTSTALSLIADMPGAISTGVRCTRLAAGNVRLFDLIMGAAFARNTSYRLIATVRASVATTIGVGARAAVALSSTQITWASALAIPAGVSQLDLTGLTPDAAMTATAGIVITSNAPSGPTVDVTAVAIMLAPAAGPYFDGSTPPTTTTRYSWAGVANRSDSIEETASGEAGWNAQWAAIDANAAAVVTMPPGQLQAAGTNPLAWIGLLSTRGGETWTVRARVWIPQLMNVRIRPVAYSGPYATAATVLPYSASAVGAGDWQTLEIVFAPGLTSSWIGLQFETSGGITWGDVPPAMTWADADAAGTTWGDLSNILVDHVDVLGPSGSSDASVLVFSGRITDLEGLFDSSWDEPAMNVTATDFLGDLGNRYIGDQPWTMEKVPSRITRILSLSARPGEPAIQVEIAQEFTSIDLSYDDVDHQAASGLLTEIAESVDGVLWSATHPVIGPYIKLEDPADRLALYELKLSGSTIVIAEVTFAPDDPTAPPSISACDVVRDPVRFVTNVSDIATRIAVTWLFQTVDEDGNPTTEERRYETADEVLENDVGTRSVNVQTLLTRQLDAEDVADAMLARLGASWRISGVAVADEDIDVPDSDAARMLLLLLDGVTRGGQPLLLTDLPFWSPTGTTAPIYLEGGTYSFVEGGWDLDLTVSRAAGQGHNARWDDLPNTAAWSWDAWDASITWDDLRGVAAP